MNKVGEKCFHNMKAQESCFMLYDSHTVQNRGLVEFILSLKCGTTSFDREIITIYNIAYNSLVPPRLKDRGKRMSIFKFLESRKLTGKYLFDDIQGLKYDFNFHQK